MKDNKNLIQIIQFKLNDLKTIIGRLSENKRVLMESMIAEMENQLYATDGERNAKPILLGKRHPAESQRRIK